MNEFKIKPTALLHRSYKFSLSLPCSVTKSGMSDGGPIKLENVYTRKMTSMVRLY